MGDAPADPAERAELLQTLREIAGVRAWRPLSLETYLRRAQEQRQRLAAYLAVRS